MSRAHLVLVALLAVGCSKGAPAQRTTVPKPEPAAAPAAAPAVPEQEPLPPQEGDELTITSKSPEAIEHFKKGRDLAENQRFAEAAEHLKKAVELDPDFAQATTALGQVTPGGDGLKLIDHGADLAAKLPQSERMWIETIHAGARGDVAKRNELLHSLAAAKPRDWRVQLRLSQLAFEYENWAEATSAAQRVSAQNPKVAAAYNLIAYGHAWQGHFDEAIAAAHKQVELLPDEPNPYDTLGEILMAAGKLDEALAAFDKATAKSPQFTSAHIAGAVIQLLKGNTKDAFARFHKAQETAPRAIDALQVGYAMAWALGAQGKLGEVGKVYDAMAQKAAEAKLDVQGLFIVANRGFLLGVAGKGKDAVAQLDKAAAQMKAADLPAETARDLSLNIELGRLVTGLHAKDKEAVAKAAAAVEELEKGREIGFARPNLAVARGFLALSKGDGKGAVAALQDCSLFDEACRWSMVAAQRAAGDKAGAKETLARLRAAPHRDTAYFYFWATTK